jgi:hypothetical protein
MGLEAAPKRQESSRLNSLESENIQSGDFLINALISGESD